MFDSDHPFTRILWGFLASVAGAITALSFRPFKGMGRWDIALALFVGASFAIFVGPWATHLAFGDGPVDIRVLGGLFYVMASGSNILIPLAIRKVSQMFGAKEDAA